MLRAALLSLCALATAASATEIPDLFKKTAVPSVADNYILQKYSAKDADPKFERLKIFSLYLVVRNLCESVVPDAARERELAHDTMVVLGTGSHDATRFDVVQLFRGFDKRDLIHLCAGGMTLYGPNGTMVPGLIRSMPGTSKLPYVVGDLNPIINVVVP